MTKISNTRGKFAEELKEDIVGKNNAKMLNCAIIDQMGSIPILIWGEKIEQIQSGSVYQFNSVGKRYREQMKFLTATRAVE